MFKLCAEATEGNSAEMRHSRHTLQWYFLRAGEDVIMLSIADGEGSAQQIMLQQHSSGGSNRQSQGMSCVEKCCCLPLTVLYY